MITNTTLLCILFKLSEKMKGQHLQFDSILGKGKVVACGQQQQSGWQILRLAGCVDIHSGTSVDSGTWRICGFEVQGVLMLPGDCVPVKDSDTAHEKILAENMLSCGTWGLDGERILNQNQWFFTEDVRVQHLESENERSGPSVWYLYAWGIRQKVVCGSWTSQTRINMSAVLVMWLRLTLKPEYLVTGEMRMKLSEL